MITTICALSRHEAERAHWLPSDAIISITSPEPALKICRPPTLWGASAVLWLAFHDITSELETDAGIWEPLSNDQAMAMVEFVRTIPSQITRLVIHCEEGVSRSVGAAVTFADLLAAPWIILRGVRRPFTSDLLSQGNPWVRRQVRTAWERRALSFKPEQG